MSEATEKKEATNSQLMFPRIAQHWVEGVRESAEGAREMLEEGVDALSMVGEGTDAQAALARAHDALRSAITELDELLHAPGLSLTSEATRHLNSEVSGRTQ
jgi:hypothetical protein